MASFHIHADQENRPPELRKAKDVSATSQAQLKRIILGVINDNGSRGAQNRAVKPVSSFLNIISAAQPWYPFVTSLPHFT